MYIDLEAVKAGVSVPRMLEDHGWSPVGRVRGALRGPGICHGSVRPRGRTLHVTERYWWCYRCERGGDVIELYGLLHGLLFVAALRAVAERYLTRIPAVRQRRAARQTRRPNRDEAL